MATKRMKGAKQTVNREEPVLEDRISELPDDVVVRIFSLLPTIASIGMSLLSRRWRRVWTLVPTVDINMTRDVAYCNQKRSGLIKFVDKSLSHPFPSTTVSKFKFRMDLDEDCDRVDGWLRYPILKNVKELELYVETRNPYTLPEFILHLSGLACIKLSGHMTSCLILTTRYTVPLPLLKELCLEYVTLDDGVVNNLLSCCTSLEKLKIHSCYGLQNLEFSSSSLKYMEFCPQHYDCAVVKVKAINLRSFVFRNGHCHGDRRVDLAQCPAIRNLSISGACLDDEWFENCIPEFTLLKSLKISNCFGMQRLNIRNPNLKSIVFDSCQNLNSLEATINAQSLEHFCYCGDSMFKITVNAPNLVNADIRVHGHHKSSYDKEWYASLIKFLKEFNGCNTVHMTCSSKMAFIIPDEVREKSDPPFPDLKSLKVKTLGSASYKKNMFQKSLLWLAPSLEALNIEQVQDPNPFILV